MFCKENNLVAHTVDKEGGQTAFFLILLVKISIQLPFADGVKVISQRNCWHKTERVLNWPSKVTMGIVPSH